MGAVTPYASVGIGGFITDFEVADMAADGCDSANTTDAWNKGWRRVMGMGLSGPQINVNKVDGDRGVFDDDFVCTRNGHGNRLSLENIGAANSGDKDGKGC
jgi:hypothetical protein